MPPSRIVYGADSALYMLTAWLGTLACFAQVRQDTKDKEASDSDSDCIDLDSPSPRTTTHPPTAPTTNAPHPHPAERLPYALQCYQLVIWLLQRPCLDALEWKEGTHGRLCHAVLSETFVCLGGSAQQYSACVLSTLSAALQMLAATRPKVRTALVWSCCTRA